MMDRKHLWKKDFPTGTKVLDTFEIHGFSFHTQVTDNSHSRECRDSDINFFL
jgi:hypothetical protein